MGEWYWIGAAAGLSAGAGVLLAGFLAFDRRWLALSLALAGACGVAIGFAIENWQEAIGGLVGGVSGAIGAAQVAAGTLRRGGTRIGTALLFGGAGLIVAGLGLVPALGYAEAVLLPALAVRLRRRAGERYAGLRILARD